MSTVNSPPDAPPSSSGLSGFPLQPPSMPDKVAQYSTWQEAQLNGVEIIIGDKKKLPSSESSSESQAYVYAWPTSPEDEKLVRSLLHPAADNDPDFKSPSTWVIVPQYKCLGCGKLSGFADSVYTALVDSVHSAEFIIAAIKNGEPNKTPVRYVKCAGCGCPSPFPTGWATGSAFSWTYDDDELKSLETC
ncbi:hypothetical protein B0H63DRAFT_528081 [Podospora didyma]|uniref:Uncharacterized protein n=1 Tax=Podospora didyma TaxID=330526 RepID=A0AAE0K683_9PEZI|nr:hypothetical protein B0H63DRAFT_528081 [Podospora didyma]